MYALFIPLKNVCANSKIDSILKFVCVMLTYHFHSVNRRPTSQFAFVKKSTYQVSGGPIEFSEREYSHI